MKMSLDRNFSAVFSLVDAVKGSRAFMDEARDMAASCLRVTPPYVDLMVGSCLYVSLNAIFKELTFLSTPSPQLDAAAGRLLAVAAFVSIQ